MAGLLTGSASAATATAVYPGGNASSFNTSDGGWTSEAQYAGLCVVGLTCPQLSGSFVADGGAGGSSDGFIRTNSGAITLVSLLSTSTDTWTSPEFTYNGVGGKAAENARFSIAVDPAVASLLNLGVNVNVSARIVPASGNGEQTLIEPVSPGTTTGWQTIDGQIGPGDLAVGQRYKIQVVVSIGGLAAVLPSGSIGFDNVSLMVSRDDDNGGGGNGNGTVTPPPKNVPAGQGFYYKGRLYVRARCPRAFKPACRIRATVLTRLHRGKAMTRTVGVTVRRGKYKRVALTVKPKFRAQMQRLAKVKHKSVILRMKVKSRKGKRHGTVFNSLRVLENHR